MEDFLSQAQGESEGLTSTYRELEREEDQENTRKKSEIIGEDTEFGTSENNLDRKILDLNQIVSPTDREKLEKVQQNSDPRENVKKKISEGMLWHTRLGHASLEYLKQLQKSEEKLEKVKFDREVSQWDLLNQYHFQGKISSSLCLLTITPDTPEHIVSNTKTKLENV